MKGFYLRVILIKPIKNRSILRVVLIKMVRNRSILRIVLIKVVRNRSILRVVLIKAVKNRSRIRFQHRQMSQESVIKGLQLRIVLIKLAQTRSQNRSQNGQFPRSRGNGNGKTNKNNALAFPFPPFPKKTGTDKPLKNKKKKSFPRSHILRIWWGVYGPTPHTNQQSVFKKTGKRVTASAYQVIRRHPDHNNPQEE